jgi:hypothetical protein
MKMTKEQHMITHELAKGLGDGMLKALTALMEFLLAAGIRWKTIESGDDAGVWLPLAATLRKCGYAGREAITLDRANIKRMLIDGKIQAAVELNDFATYFAPMCRVPVALELGVEYLNTFVSSVYKTGRPANEPEPSDPVQVMEHLETREEHIEYANRQAPGAGNFMSLPTTRVAICDGKLALGTDDFDLSTMAGAVDGFLKVFPEWADDVMDHPELGRVMTIQFSLALSRWLCQWGVGDPDTAVAFQRALMQQILDDGGEFGPASTQKRRKRRK